MTTFLITLDRHDATTAESSSPASSFSRFVFDRQFRGQRLK